MSVSTRLVKISGVLLAAASLALVSGVSTPSRLQAQTPPKPAAGAQKAAPATGQPQAGKGSGMRFVTLKPAPNQAEWTKVCGTDDKSKTEVCYTTRDFVSDSGQPVLSAAVYDVKGPKSVKTVRLLLPIGLLIPPGIRFGVDKSQPVPGKYALCVPAGCFAEAQVKDEFVTGLKKGQTLHVSARTPDGQVVTFAAPAEGFAKAYDGAPIDPEILAQRQQQLMEDTKRRADELRERLRQGAAGGAAPAARPGDQQPKP